MPILTTDDAWYVHVIMVIVDILALNKHKAIGN